MSQEQVRLHSTVTHWRKTNLSRGELWHTWLVPGTPLPWWLENRVRLDPVRSHPRTGQGVSRAGPAEQKSARVVPVCSQSVSSAVARTRSGTHGRKSPEEVGECVGADEGSSPLGKASRAYRPLASDRAAHSAPHTKRVDNTRTLSGAHAQMGSSPSTQVVSRKEQCAE